MILRHPACLWLLSVAVLAGAVELGLFDSLLPEELWRRRLVDSICYWGLALLLLGLLRHQWRRRRAKVLVALGSALTAALAFEVCAWAFELEVGSPKIGNMGGFSTAFHHIYPPSSVVFLGDFEETQVHLHTNEDGLRSSHDRADFRGHAPRLAILGDSFAFGLGVRRGHDLGARLEELLREEEGLEDAAVLNAGIVSYSPYLERLLYEDLVVAYEPELVLALVDLGDVFDDMVYEQLHTGTTRQERFDVPSPRVEEYRDPGVLWRVTRHLRRRLAVPYQLARIALGCPLEPEPEPYAGLDVQLDVGGRIETDPFFVLRRPLEETRPLLENLLSNLDALAASVERSGARFVAVVYPRYQHWSQRECPENWERHLYSTNEPHQDAFFEFFAEASQRVDYPILDLTPAFRATDEFPLVFRGDPHWNERGHAFVAATLAAAILEHGWLERHPSDPAHS